MKLHPGKHFRNYYWLTGPGEGETGRRVTVLHSNQPRQCSWCFLYGTPPGAPTLPSHCKGGGNGKVCEEMHTPRARMADYIQDLKNQGYTSLRDRYYEELRTSYPSLTPTVNPNASFS